MPFRRSPKLSYSPTVGEIFQLIGYRTWSQPTGFIQSHIVRRHHLPFSAVGESACALFAGAIEQFAGGAAEFVGYFAAEHARDLLGAIAGFQNRDAATSRAASLFFFDGEMPIGERGDLRQMSDA